MNAELGADIPLVLMNSFNTEEEAKACAARYDDIHIMHFNQSQFPRICRDTLLPLATGRDSPPECWYPPGHGDVLDGLRNSGILDVLLTQGRTHIFISNSDNLAALLDLRPCGCCIP